jgi:2-dehydropantoate 2-reductase
VRGQGQESVVRGSIVTSFEAGTPKFDWILLATQPPQVEEAARNALPLLAPNGAMVCFQNGLCETRIEALFPRGEGRDRVVGAVVAWGASMPEPGLYERTSAGGFTLGLMDGADDPRLSELATLLEPIGPVSLTKNLAGARWSKLAINCAISTLGTLGGARLGELMMHRPVRRLALEIMTEVVAIARAEKVRLEKVSGTIDLDWIALTPAERKVRGSAGLVAKHSMLLAVGARYRRMRSSMLAAIERGRTPAVDFLNGEIVTRGVTEGIPTPVNAEAQRLVHALARREITPGMPLIHRLAEVAATQE